METVHDDAAAPATVDRSAGDRKGQTVLQIVVDRGVGTPPRLCGKCKWWMEAAKPFTTPGDRCPSAGEAGLRCPACVEAEKALATRTVAGLEKVRRARGLVESLLRPALNGAASHAARANEAAKLLSEFLTANGGE